MFARRFEGNSMFANVFHLFILQVFVIPDHKFSPEKRFMLLGVFYTDMKDDCKFLINFCQILSRNAVGGQEF